jgi:hypothetical protein
LQEICRRQKVTILTIDGTTAFFACLAALIWGAIWAAFHQFIPTGRYVNRKQTWLTVVSGCAGNLLITLFAVDFSAWLVVMAVFAFSSVFVGIRAVYNAQKETEETERSVEELRELIAELKRGALDGQGATGAGDAQEAAGRGDRP